MKRILLDTQALVWWLEAKENPSSKARTTIENMGAEIFVSAVSAWELASKTHIGKFKPAELVDGLEKEIEEEGFLELPVSMKHALRAGRLASSHKDPFDRMLIAQAEVEGMPIISNEKVFDGFSVRRIW